jgi:hypothetical protein
MFGSCSSPLLSSWRFAIFTKTSRVISQRLIQILKAFAALALELDFTLLHCALDLRLQMVGNVSIASQVQCSQRWMLYDCVTESLTT